MALKGLVVNINMSWHLHNTQLIDLINYFVGVYADFRHTAFVSLVHHVHSSSLAKPGVVTQDLAAHHVQGCYVIVRKAAPSTMRSDN